MVYTNKASTNHLRELRENIKILKLYTYEALHCAWDKNRAKGNVQKYNICPYCDHSLLSFFTEITITGNTSSLNTLESVHLLIFEGYLKTEVVFSVWYPSHESCLTHCKMTDVISRTVISQWKNNFSGLLYTGHTSLMCKWIRTTVQWLEVTQHIVVFILCWWFLPNWPLISLWIRSVSFCFSQTLSHLRHF
jgi:hypothetical protein